MSSQCLKSTKPQSNLILTNDNISSFSSKSNLNGQNYHQHKSFDDEAFSSITYDDDENTYPDNSKFPACSYFGDGVVFGDGCVFGAGAVFGKYARFGRDCIFGSNCRFGINAQFGVGCSFEGKQTFASGTQFGIESHF